MPSPTPIVMHKLHTFDAKQRAANARLCVLLCSKMAAKVKVFTVFLFYTLKKFNSNAATSGMFV